MTKKKVASEDFYPKVINLGLKHMKVCQELDELTLNGLWDRTHWEAELTNPGRLCLGILGKTELLAFGCGWFVLDELHLTIMAVHPSHRRKGLAKLILSKMLLEAQKEGITRATLEVSKANVAARELYKSCGFKTAGQRTKYYRDGSDAIIQWRDLNK